MDQLKNLSFLTLLKPKNDGDFADRMMYYTVIILTWFALIIFGWSFFGTPIQCWFPAQFTEYWNQYALDYCYVENKYFRSFSDDEIVADQIHSQVDHWMNPSNFEHKNTIFKRNAEYPDKIKGDGIVTYYQWIPFVMVMMAIWFHFPTMLWRFFYETTSSAGTIFNRLQSVNVSMEPEERKSRSKWIALFLHARNDFLDKGKKLQVLYFRWTQFAFISVKAISLLMCLAQFFWLEYFLGLHNSWWGVTVLYDLYRNRGWNETGHFPRVTFCDFQVRTLGNIQSYTVQCVLLINMFNEKFFIFLWFWLALMLIVTTLSFSYWTIFAMIGPVHSQRFADVLSLIDPTTINRYSKKYRLARKFMKNSFDSDTFFFLHIIEMNDGDVLCREVITSMWDQYQKWDKKSVDAEPEKLFRNHAFYLKSKPVDYPTLPSRARLNYNKGPD